MHWLQMTTGDVLLDQRAGAAFQADPKRVKATWLDDNGRCVGVRDDLTWFVGHVDVDLGLSCQRATMLRRWATGRVPLLGGPEVVAQVIAVETEDGDRAYRYELTLAPGEQAELRALMLDDNGNTLAERTLPLG